MPYNLHFIKKAFKYELPDYINFDLLFNIGYCVENKKIKLYFISDEKYYLYKCSQNGKIIKQFDASKIKIETSKLDNFLNYKFNYQDLIIDTVENDIFYIYIEESSFEQQIRFLEKLLSAWQLDQNKLFQIASKLNYKNITSFSDIYDYKAISMIKISLLDNNHKIYARPYLTNNDFILSKETKKFLLNVYDCSKEMLDNYIKNLWISYNFGNKQTTISTQNNKLKEFLNEPD